MNRTLERRSFLKTMALGLGTMALPSAFAKKKPARKLKIGHTCITWGTFPARETTPRLNRRSRTSPPKASGHSRPFPRSSITGIREVCWLP